MISKDGITIALRPERAILSISRPLAAKKNPADKVGKGNGRTMAAPPTRAGTRPLSVFQVFKEIHFAEVQSSFEQAYLMAGWQAPGTSIPIKYLSKF